MAIKIKKNGKIEQFTLHSTDVKVLDLEGKFKKKDLESVIREISDTEHIHIGEIDTTKDGIWIDDGEILDNSESNGVVERLKTFVNETIGELSNLTTSIKSNLVGAINELKGNVDQLSNPNLLINGDFQVWQRGTSFNVDNSVKYTTDRWRIISDAGMKLTQEPYGVRIETTSVGGWHNFEQYIELPKYLKGKKVTANIKLHSEGVIKQFYAGVKSPNTGDILFLASEFNSVEVDSFKHTFEIPNGDHNLLFVGIQIEERVGATLEIEYFKLELGEYVTPFIPRSFGEELALCKRYYQRTGNGITGFINSTTDILMAFQFQTEMRIKPTITLIDADGNIALSQIKITSIIAYAGNTKGLQYIRLACENTSLAQFKFTYLDSNKDMLQLDAEIY